MSQVVFKNVHKIYDKKVVAVQDASFEIKDITGSSGQVLARNSIDQKTG